MMEWVLGYLVVGFVLGLADVRLEAYAYGRLYDRPPVVDTGDWISVIISVFIWPILFPISVLFYLTLLGKARRRNRPGSRSVLSYLTGYPDGD